LSGVFSSDRKACVLAAISNVFAPVSLFLPMLTHHSMEMIEQALIRSGAGGCEDLYLILTTLGGDIHFPELFVQKVRGLGFKHSEHDYRYISTPLYCFSDLSESINT